MSTRRVSRFTQDEVTALIFKLQTLLQDPSSIPRNKRVSSASKVLKEACDYIKNLQREVDDLSGKLSQILASGDIAAVDEDVIRTLLQQ